MSVFRNAVLVIALLSSALVFAQGKPHTNGKGWAESGDHRRGQFDFEIAKKHVENRDLANGRFQIECTDPNVEGVVRIKTREIGELNFDGHRANFAGPGSIRFVRRSNHEVVERGGRVRVMALDNRAAGSHDGSPDRIAVTFTGEGKNPITYSFEGNVYDGDIVVHP